MRPPQIVNKLIRFLALLLACFASTFTPTALALGSPIGGTVYIGYDANVAYDGSQNSSSAYEDAARPPTGDEKHASGAARTFLSQIADFVAAESSGIFTNYEARIWYETKVAKIDVSGAPTEALARSVVDQRNALGSHRGQAFILDLSR